MLVSFIIPAYNAADTIARCLDSIVTQSWDDMSYEIIVIDDASIDNTVQVIEDYRERLRIGDFKFDIGNLILLRQQENHRQGAARNRGVRISKGEYICFVDADDVVSNGMASALRLAKDKNTDMTALHYGNSNEQVEMTSEGKWLSFEDQYIFTGIEMQTIHPWWCSAPWAYIYRKEFLKTVNYPFAEDVLYEDADFVMAHIFLAKRMAYSPQLGYVAYIREGSTTHSMTHRNITDFVLLGLRMLRLHERILSEVNEKTYKYAEDVLDGACWNIYISAKRLIKLSGPKEVCAFYKRLDAMVDRETIYSDNRLHKYYWNTWTTICMKHKNIAIALLTCFIPMYRVLKGVKRR